MLSRRLFEMAPEAADAGYQAMLLDCMTTGKSFFLPQQPSYIARKREGKLVYLNIRFEPLREAGGEINSVMLVAADATEQVLDAQLLEQREERLNLALDASRMGVWELELASGSFVRTLKHDEIFGYPSGRAYWTMDNLLQHIVPGDRQKAVACFREAPITGHLSVKLQVHTAAQQLAWINLFGKLKYDEAGNASRIIGTIADITAQQKGEEALQQTTEELERQVQQRTLALQKMNYYLEQFNRKLKEFAYVALHDLQEPVRKIVTFTTFLLEDESSCWWPNGRYTLDRIQNAASRMKRLIEDLLLFSDIAREEQEEVFAEIDLNQVWQQVKEYLSIDIARLDASIQADALPVLKGIPSQIQQLLQNLLSNSLKFIQPGNRPQITLQHE